MPPEASDWHPCRDVAILLRSTAPVECGQEDQAVSKNRRNTPRMPATKFANLRKKMQQKKLQARPVKKGKK